MKKRTGTIEFLCLAAIAPLVCAAIFAFCPGVRDSVFSLPLLGLQSMAPSLAAVLVVGQIHAAKGLTAFLREKYLSGISLKLCLSAFFTPLVLLLVSKTLAVFFLEGDIKFFLPDASKMLIILWALIAEELGWRGFLQERGEAKLGPVLTPLVVGVVWGLWHVFFFLSGAMEAPFFWLVLGCVFESYGYFVITKLSGGNIVPASIWHFSGNLFIHIFGLNVADSHGGHLPYAVMTLTYGLCVLGFLAYYRALPRKGRPV